MMDRRQSHQRGMSMMSMLFFMVILAALGVLIAQAFPTVLEFQAVRRAIDKSKGGSTPVEIRGLFDRAAQVDNISSVGGKDLEITRTGSGFVIRFAYEREIHLFGPAYLLLKYSGGSDK
jgi:hypothetical protein